MEARAVAKYIRISPQKARLVADAIRAKKAGDAVHILNLMPKKKVQGLLKKSWNQLLPMQTKTPALILIISMSRKLL